jgi:hypothetical protein
VKDTKAFLEAYHSFRRSVDFARTGILPEEDYLVWCILMGIPSVPADDQGQDNADLLAVDQRVAILKAVFVEVNRGQPDAFLDEGLVTYDRAAEAARRLLRENRPPGAGS